MYCVFNPVEDTISMIARSAFLQSSRKNSGCKIEAAISEVQIHEARILINTVAVLNSELSHTLPFTTQVFLSTTAVTC